MTLQGQEKEEEEVVVEEEEVEKRGKQGSRARASKMAGLLTMYVGGAEMMTGSTVLRVDSKELKCRI